MTIQATHLRCEHRTAPLAVDCVEPRLSWICEAEGRGRRQTAYRIQVATNAAFAGDLLWDTERVASGDSLLVPYAGQMLAACQRCFWRVRLWDEEGEEGPWSEVAPWSVGLLHEAWPASWILSPLAVSPNAGRFRREFDCPADVKDARLYATARGVYRPSLNGQRVGDEELAPGWTDYKKRILYQCYDILPLLRPGEANCLGALLGEGWYKGSLSWQQLAHVWGDRTMLLMALRLERVDGTVQWIGTDAEWRTQNSHILESSLMRGEIQDGSLIETGWDAPGFDTRDWFAVSERQVQADDPKLLAHAGMPVRCTEALAAKEIWQARPGVWIVDFGQNFTGRVRLKLNVPAGTTLRLRHGEMVLPDRTLYVDNLRSATSIDTYTAAGTQDEIWEPAFTFHGFQYAELAGHPEEPTLDQFTGVVLGSDTPRAGGFSCSHAMINQLYSNCVWTQRANYLEIPTDCPQRDERLGWTGDAQAYVRSATYNMDISAFFTKWLDDLNDAQGQEGRFTNFAPNVPGVGAQWGMGNADAAWGDAGTICPWTLYQVYGDERLLATCYPHMQRWGEWLHKDAQNGLRRWKEGAYCCFGDWLNVEACTSRSIIMTAFYAYSLRILADAARVLDHASDEKRYREWLDQAVQAFGAAFLHADGRVLDPPEQSAVSQTAQVLALHFDLVPEGQRQAVFGHLATDIEARDKHLSTGFVGLSYLMPVLARFGRLELAYTLLENTTYPSWGYSVENGATTIWERWNGWKKETGPHDPGMNSYSHYAYGSVCEWFFHTICGIDLLEPGFRKIRIAPRPGGSLTEAKASFIAPTGRIESGWVRQNDTLQVDITVPANVAAEVVLSGAITDLGDETAVVRRDERHVSVGSGTYRFVCAL